MKAAFTGLVFSVAGLLALGLVMLYSASMLMLNKSLKEVGAHYLVAQLEYCGLGLVICAIMAKLDYALLRRFAWPIFGLAIVMLALVFVPPIGIHRNGASRWLGYDKTSVLQPSEFAKLALIIAIAWYGAKYQAQMSKLWRGLLLPAVFVGALLALLFKEPDRGTTALLVAVSGAMLVLAGVRWGFILPPLGAGAVGFVIYLLRDPMAGRRMIAWLHPEENKLGIGNQAYEAMIALGSGGLTGLGLGNGRQKLGFIPMHHTDFILSIIGEELGLIGTLAVVVLFLVLVMSGFAIARNARDTFGTLLAFGITTLIGLQAAINIGVVTSALPNKGLPLPFISYGGSNLVMMLTCVGVLLSIARRATVSEALPLPQADTAEIAGTKST